VGDLVISGAYIPQPASPDVAAAYFTITNSGTRTDRLVAVHTNVAGQVMPMTETENGTTGSMSDLGSVQIPAGGTFAFTRGHAHLMLEKPNVTLREGDRVAVTVRFAHAGSVRFSIPVVPVTGPPDQSATRSGMTMSRSH
jgi:copper(I)-binding protein